VREIFCAIQEGAMFCHWPQTLAITELCSITQCQWAV